MRSQQKCETDFSSVCVAQMKCPKGTKTSPKGLRERSMSLYSARNDLLRFTGSYKNLRIFWCIKHGFPPFHGRLASLKQKHRIPSNWERFNVLTPVHRRPIEGIRVCTYLQLVVLSWRGQTGMKPAVHRYWRWCRMPRGSLFQGYSVQGSPAGKAASRSARTQTVEQIIMTRTSTRLKGIHWDEFGWIYILFNIFGRLLHMRHTLTS